MDTNILSKDDCNKILQQKLLHSNFKLEDIDIKPFSEDSQGFMGQHFILKLSYKTSGQTFNESFFVKTKPKNEFYNNLTEELQLYKKEFFFYNNLITEFQKSGYKTDFVPKMYLCKNMETIVLGNLKEEGYGPHVKLFSGEVELKAALKSLAVLHANSISYEERRSKKQGTPYRIGEDHADLFKEVIFKEDKNSFGYKFCQGSIEGLLVVLKLIPQTKEWKKILVHKLLNFNPAKYIGKDFGLRKAVTHCDLWRNNILFKYDQEELTECRLIDFQVIRYYYPAFDVLLLIFIQTLKDFREKNYSSLIDFYFSTFEEVLQNNGFCSLDVFPENDFRKSLDLVRPLAYYSALVYKTMRYMPNSTMMNCDNVEDILFKNETKVKLIEELYKNNETARNVLVEILYELYDIL